MSSEIKCPRCGIKSKKHSVRTRKVLDVNGYIEIEAVTYSCPLHKYFTVGNDGSRYSKALKLLGSELLEEYTILRTQEVLKKKCGVWIPHTTVSEWRYYGKSNVD